MMLITEAKTQLYRLDTLPKNKTKHLKKKIKINR